MEAAEPLAWAQPAVEQRAEAVQARQADGTPRDDSSPNKKASYPIRAAADPATAEVSVACPAALEGLQESSPAEAESA